MAPPPTERDNIVQKMRRRLLDGERNDDLYAEALVAYRKDRASHDYNKRSAGRKAKTKLTLDDL